MPTYVYRREDGTTFEIEQRITEPALETCPTTGLPVKRMITGGAGLIFKGSGFYITDYAHKNSSSSNGRQNGQAASAKKGAKSETAKTESKKDTSPTPESDD